MGATLHMIENNDLILWKQTFSLEGVGAETDQGGLNLDLANSKHEFGRKQVHKQEGVQIILRN